jgi:branched-chain amino acid transport system permease protein
MTLILEGVFRSFFGVSGMSYNVPDSLTGAINVGFMFLPIYRAWVVLISLVVCFGTWFVIERTKLGAYLRAGTENPKLVQAFGINFPLMVTLTYGFGVALAALSGVLAAPIIQVSPLMGSNLIIAIFAIVVIGGMGSILSLSRISMPCLRQISSIVLVGQRMMVAMVAGAIVLACSLIWPTARGV